MELKQLTYFLAVADCLSFSRAAEKLYISQPALSYQIAELERELGAELFVRDRRSVSLTPMGRQLLKPVRAVIDDTVEIRKLARRRLDESGFFERLCLYFEDGVPFEMCTPLPRLIGAFMLRHPNVDFGLRRAGLDGCLELLQQNGDIDAALLMLHHGEVLPAGLEEQTVRSDRLVAVVPNGVPEMRTPEDVFHRYELAVLKSAERTNVRLLDYLGTLGLAPTVHPVDTPAAAFAYLFAERAALVLPRRQLLLLPGQDVRLVELPGEAVELRCVLAWNRRHTSSALLELRGALSAQGAWDGT